MAHDRSLPRRTRRLAAALLLPLAFAAAPTARSAPADTGAAAAEPPHAVDLKVLTYNIKGLPLITDLDRL